SSSASTAGKVVKVPCPSSAAGDTIEMEPSVAIVTQIFAESGPSAAAASPMRARGSAWSVSAKGRPAAVCWRTSRRLTDMPFGTVNAAIGGLPGVVIRWEAAYTQIGPEGENSGQSRAANAAGSLSPQGRGVG